jgi:hypothetical protein
VEHKLAAILAADVVGYSRLIEQDEAGTLAALDLARRGKGSGMKRRAGNSPPRTRITVLVALQPCEHRAMAMCVSGAEQRLPETRYLPDASPGMGSPHFLGQSPPGQYKPQ